MKNILRSKNCYSCIINPGKVHFRYRDIRNAHIGHADMGHTDIGYADTAVGRCTSVEATMVDISRPT